MRITFCKNFSKLKQKRTKKINRSNWNQTLFQIEGKEKRIEKNWSDSEKKNKKKQSTSIQKSCVQCMKSISTVKCKTISSNGINYNRRLCEYRVITILKNEEKKNGVCVCMCIWNGAVNVIHVICSNVYIFLQKIEYLTLELIDWHFFIAKFAWI